MMSVLGAAALAEQRRAARRAQAQGRRWYLRGILMIVVAVVALLRGGQVNTTIGVVMMILSLMSWHLGRQMRRQAAEMERKISLMEEGTGGTAAQRHGDAHA